MRLSPRPLGAFLTPLFYRLKSGTKHMFEKQLLLTNLCLSSGLSGVGDCLEQRYEMYEKPGMKYDYRRTFNMSVSGLTIGLFCHHWYNYLDKLVPGRTFMIAVRKMIVDQIIGSPVSISIFFGTMAIVEKSTFDEFVRELRCKMWKLYVAEWVIWPPAQLINFYLLPTKYRVLWDNTVSLCYDVYTSRVKHDNDVDCEESKIVSQKSSSIKKHNQIMNIVPERDSL